MKLFDLSNILKLETINQVNTTNGRYYVDGSGKKYLSVTTVISSIPNEGLEKWKKRVGKKESNRISIETSERGKIMHHLIENYFNGIIELKYTKHKTAMSLFYKIRKHLNKIDNIRLLEIPLYSPTHGIAGQEDLIADYDGDFSIIDFKTSYKPKKVEWLSNYFMQISVYKYMFEEMTKNEYPIKQGVIIISCEQGSSQVFTITESEMEGYYKEFLKWKYILVRKINAQRNPANLAIPN